MASTARANPQDRSDSRTPVQIDADIYVRLRDIADAADRSTTAQVNRALREWLEAQKAA